MAIFGKKLKTAEEVLEAIKGLSDEEQEKLMAAINGTDGEPVADDGEEVVAEDKDETVEEVAGDGKPTEEETVAEETKPGDGEEVVDETADVAEEPVVGVAEEPAPENDDKYADILGRLEAMEAKFEAMQHKPVEADEDVARKLDKLASRFGG